LGQRGWQAGDFEHLLVLDFGDPRRTAAFADLAVDADAADGVGAIEVRVCSQEERSAWAEAAARGFSDGEAPEQGHQEFSAVMAARQEAVLVLAWVDGVPAGTGTLVVDGGVGWLSGDSTLREYRRRGIQQAIQRFRLQLAREAGCELAVTEAVPGGASQRNMERVGFRIAYTHVEFIKEAPHGT
jgi:GNAT superfamily N-acetyltransferase